MNINEWGELAEWDTTSRKYRRKIRRLRRYSLHSNTGDAYVLGLLTWEHARALMGIRSDPRDPRWGRFFVPAARRGDD